MKPSLKYRVIKQCVGKYPVEAMCKFYGVSRSGYYRYIHHKDKPAKDVALASMIAECQNIRGKGHRYIQLWLEKTKGFNTPRKHTFPLLKNMALHHLCQGAETLMIMR